MGLKSVQIASISINNMLPITNQLVINQQLLPWLPVIIFTSIALLPDVTTSLPVVSQLPVSITVTQGDTAEFTCEVKGHQDGDDILWLIEDKDPTVSGSNIVTLKALDIGKRDIAQFPQYKLGAYYTEYVHIQRNRIQYKLQIRNVTMHDGQLRFACAYRPKNRQAPTLFDTFVDLTVLLPEPPQHTSSPVRIPPAAKISQNVLRTNSNGVVHAEFLCEDITTSTTDSTSDTDPITYFRWSWYPDMGEGVVEISYSSGASTLKMTGDIANNTAVTCEIIIPAISVSNAITTAIIIDYASFTEDDDFDTETVSMTCQMVAILSAIFSSLICLVIGLCCGLIAEHKFTILQRTCCHGNKQQQADPDTSSPRLPQLDIGIYQPVGAGQPPNSTSSMASSSHEYDLPILPSSVLNSNNDSSAASNGCTSEKHCYKSLKKDEVRKDQSNPAAYTPLKPTGGLLYKMEQQQRHSNPAYLII